MTRERNQMLRNVPMNVKSTIRLGDHVIPESSSSSRKRPHRRVRPKSRSVSSSTRSDRRPTGRSSSWTSGIETNCAIRLRRVPRRRLPTITMTASATREATRNATKIIVRDDAQSLCHTDSW